ncbi:MAG: nuclear transport factor 2 family protein [Solirubrobacterales bacterium]
MSEAETAALVAQLEERLRTLEDREEIRSLVARYNWVMDDRDLPGIRDLFTEDAQVRSNDGALESVGREAVVAMYQGRFEVLGPSLHWAHDHRVFPDPTDSDRATGTVSLHAEMTRFGVAAVSAIRYDDAYRRCADGIWRFSERRLSFFYFMDPREYPEVMEHSDRVRSSEQHTAAGFPEGLESWRRYYAEFPRPTSAGEGSQS